MGLTIYALIAEDTLFYIGKTTQPVKERLSEHISEAMSSVRISNTKKSKLIRALTFEGIEVSIKPLKENAAADDEYFFIDHCWSNSIPLLNEKEGDKGKPMTSAATKQLRDDIQQFKRNKKKKKPREFPNVDRAWVEAEYEKLCQMQKDLPRFGCGFLLTF